jgi:hypothetical protein
MCSWPMFTLVPSPGIKWSHWMASRHSDKSFPDCWSSWIHIWDRLIHHPWHRSFPHQLSNMRFLPNSVLVVKNSVNFGRRICTNHSINDLQTLNSFLYQVHNTGWTYKVNVFISITTKKLHMENISQRAWVCWAKSSMFWAMLCTPNMYVHVRIFVSKFRFSAIEVVNIRRILARHISATLVWINYGVLLFMDNLLERCSFWALPSVQLCLLSCSSSKLVASSFKNASCKENKCRFQCEKKPATTIAMVQRKTIDLLTLALFCCNLSLIEFRTGLKL